MNEEIDESPYCEVCGTCGCIDCCGIRNFIAEHIEGKTNCKNESWIIQDLINLCDYKDEVFKQNEKYKEVLDKIKEKLEKDNKEAVDFTHKIETSDLQQGSYPVHYYRMLWNKELTEKYLELLEEIE